MNAPQFDLILIGSMLREDSTKIPWWSLWTFVALGVAVFGFAALSENPVDGFPNWLQEPLVFALLAVPAMLFWVVSLGLLISTGALLRPWQRLEDIPADVGLTDIPDAFASMGFVQEPVVLQPHGAMLICYPDQARHTWASLLCTPQGGLVLEYVSFLDGGFSVCTQQLPARAPSFERNLTQAFPDLYPGELLEQHEQSLGWLAERGLNIRPVAAETLGEELQVSHRADAVATFETPPTVDRSDVLEMACKEEPPGPASLQARRRLTDSRSHRPRDLAFIEG